MGSGISSEWRGASGLPSAAFRVLPPSQASPLGSQQSRVGLLSAPTMAKTSWLTEATVPRPSYSSVPGPSASIIVAPAGPTRQQWLPGGVAQGEPGARVCGREVQLRRGL